MTYTLKSNATTAAAVAVFVGDNGLTNLVDSSSVTATGTISSSTQATKLVYGHAAASANYLNITATGGVAASTKFSVLLVGVAGRDINDDSYQWASPSNTWLAGTYFSPCRLRDTTVAWGTVAAGTLTGYSHPSSTLWTLIWGRESDGETRHVVNQTETTARAGDATAQGVSIASGSWKFAGSPGGGAAGMGVGIFAVFVGVAPSELNTYIGSDAYAALFDTAGGGSSALGRSLLLGVG